MKLRIPVTCVVWLRQKLILMEIANRDSLVIGWGKGLASVENLFL